MSIVLDLDAYPFILQAFPRGRKAESDLRDLFARMEVVGNRAVERNNVHVVIAVGDEGFNAAERKIIAECMAKAPAAIAARVVGAFAVIENTLARGVVTALKWLTPRAMPIVAAATPEEAIEMAAGCLGAHGVLPPLELVERARIRARKLHRGMRSAPGA